MKTRACLFCGHRIEMRRTTVWSYDHMLDRMVKTPTGPFPDPAQVLDAHEHFCYIRMMESDYGRLHPLEKWGVSRT